jgi:hypothetical protein
MLIFCSLCHNQLKVERKVLKDFGNAIVDLVTCDHECPSEPVPFNFERKPSFQGISDTQLATDKKSKETPFKVINESFEPGDKRKEKLQTTTAPLGVLETLKSEMEG